MFVTWKHPLMYFFQFISKYTFASNVKPIELQNVSAFPFLDKTVADSSFETSTLPLSSLGETKIIFLWFLIVMWHLHAFYHKTDTVQVQNRPMIHQWLQEWFWLYILFTQLKVPL